MKICIHGETLSAWVASAKLAECGHQVMLFASEDMDSNFYTLREPGLLTLLREQEKTGRLSCRKPLRNGESAKESRIHILAADIGVEDIELLMLRLLEDAVEDVLFVILMTLPVGSLGRLQGYVDALLSQGRVGREARVVGMPLFSREGTALADFSRPSMLLLGGDGQPVREVMELMRPFVRQATQVMVVPPTTAELIKLGINAMLATRVSFINEMAALSEKLGVDVELVREGLAADPRIGGDYLQPGCGFGGPSFSDHLLSYAKTIKEELDTTGLIEAVLAINESQREILFRKLWRFFRGDLSGRRMAVWGAAFKPGSASLENSVVQPLLHALWAQGCHTAVYDPMAGGTLRQLYGRQEGLTVCASAAEAVQGADALVIVTAWDEFGCPDYDMLKSKLKQPVVFDGRNIYDPEFMSEQGFRYFAIGRGERV